MREVKITLSRDRLSLKYENIAEKSCLKKVLTLGRKGSRTIKLADFAALIYGGTTSRFKYHQKMQSLIK